MAKECSVAFAQQTNTDTKVFDAGFNAGTKFSMLASMSCLPNINNSDIEGLNYMLRSVLYMKKKGVQCWFCMTNQH